MADKTPTAENEAALKAKKQKKQIIGFVAASVIALVICIVAIMVVAFSLITEGNYKFPVQPAESLTECPTDKAQTLEYFKQLIDSTKDNKKTYVNTSTDISVDDSSVVTDGAENLKSLLMFIKGDIMSAVDGIYPENHSGAFEDGFEGHPNITLAASDFTEAACTQGQLNEETGEISNDGKYFFKFTLPGGEYPAKKGTPLFETFKLEGEKGIVNKIKEQYKDICTVKNAEITPNDFKIEATADRLTDKLENIRFIRSYNVTLDVDFCGKLAAFGSDKIAFTFNVTDKYDYKWSGIAFSSKSVTIGEGESAELAVNAVINNDSEYKVSFASADETAVSIDELGYVTGKKVSNEPVVITVTLEYLGNIYTDECEVYVRVPVEKIKISDDEASLKVGESKKLSAALKPKDATDTKIIWLSENENVASVDDEGNVTALSKGEAVIIAVSDDGYFRDSCTVTVE